MADAPEVLRALSEMPGLEPVVLVVNDKGLERAIESGAHKVRMVVAASDGMQLKNANATPAETMRRYEPGIKAARAQGTGVAGIIAVSFGCPYEGPVDPARVLDLATQFVDQGAFEISFADTVGMAVPSQVERMLTRANEKFAGTRIGIHLHNTRNMGLANAFAALRVGIDVFDASVGGCGGCPFAPKATGNIPTEDLVFMLEAMGIDTGIDLPRLIDTTRWLEGVLEHPLPAMLTRAGPCWSTPPPLA
jgi:isopropylmalate/homocitrate/citramalate synthase